MTLVAEQIGLVLKGETAMEVSTGIDSMICTSVVLGAEVVQCQLMQLWLR